MSIVDDNISAKMFCEQKAISGLQVTQLAEKPTKFKVINGELALVAESSLLTYNGCILACSSKEIKEVYKVTKEFIDDVDQVLK